MANVHDEIGPNAEFAEVAVIQGSSGRRRWSSDEKARIVKESMDPAVSISEVARRHGLNPKQLFTWRRRLRGQIAVQQSDAMAAASDAAGADQPTVAAAGTIEVETAGARIRVDAGVDEAALARVVAALRRAAP